jgi:hypothetical protein
MTNDYTPQNASDHLIHVVMTSISSLIRVAEYERIVGFQSHCAELQKDIKLLSEALICIHFCQPDHPLTPALLDGLRGIILHRYTLQAVRLNPLLATWLLNAVALLQDHYDVSRERNFALELVDRFGLHTLDAPSYRLEENRYLFAKLKGQRYAPSIDQTFERNFCRLSRDQVYALTHLLFYVSDYGMSRYSCSRERSFALEHLVCDAYLNDDVDIMLELMLVYRACEQSDQKSLALFEKLLVKRIVGSSQLHHALTEINSEHFQTHYHQCLLAMMYGQVNTCRSRLDLTTYRALRATHGFHSSLRSANYVKAAQKFTGLVGVDSARLKFCRENLDHYLALERHHLGMTMSPKVC